MNKEPILLTFGKNVQKYRISQGLSQEKLAELAGVTPNIYWYDRTC